MCYVLYTLSCYGLYDYACVCVCVGVSLLVFCGVYLCIYINRLDVLHAGGPVSVIPEPGSLLRCVFLVRILWLSCLVCCLFLTFIHVFIYFTFISCWATAAALRKFSGPIVPGFTLSDRFYSSTDVVGGL